jgi:hypothetical protein
MDTFRQWFAGLSLAAKETLRNWELAPLRRGVLHDVRYAHPTFNLAPLLPRRLIE